MLPPEIGHSPAQRVLLVLWPASPTLARPRRPIYVVPGRRAFRAPDTPKTKEESTAALYRRQIPLCRMWEGAPCEGTLRFAAVFGKKFNLGTGERAGGPQRSLNSAA